VPRLAEWGQIPDSASRLCPAVWYRPSRAEQLALWDDEDSSLTSLALLSEPRDASRDASRQKLLVEAGAT